jgi:hypothetical protein
MVYSANDDYSFIVVVDVFIHLQVVSSEEYYLDYYAISPSLCGADFLVCKLAADILFYSDFYMV